MLKHGVPVSVDGVRLPIYMDHHATTPLDERVLNAMLPYFREKFGNAASRSHQFGWTAEEAVDLARRQVAQLIAADPKDIVFTSGATESNNLALKGVAEAYQHQGSHIVTVATEHRAVLDTCSHLEKSGCSVTYLPIMPDGLLDLSRLTEAMTDRTFLVSIMAANNEIGVLQPLLDIGKLCRERGVLFHTDAAQAAGKIPIDVDALNVDLLSISGHKMYGPKGVGALYVRHKDPLVRLSAQMDGGGHERGLRSGTLNVPGIVGLGKACEICREEMPAESIRLAMLRDRLKDAILSQLEDVEVNGSLAHRLPNNLNLSFRHVEGEALMLGLSDVALSSGSACTSAKMEASYVLKSLGADEDLAHSSIRFGLGRFNNDAEVDYVVARVCETVTSLREFSPLSKAAN